MLVRSLCFVAALAVATTQAANSVGILSTYSPSNPEDFGVDQSWTSEMFWLSGENVIYVFSPPPNSDETTITYLSVNKGKTFAKMKDEGKVFPIMTNISSVASNNAVAILSDEHNKFIYTSTDRGASFIKRNVSFSPTLAKISDANQNQIMIYDNPQQDLWLSLDGGQTFSLILKNCIHGDQYTENGFTWGIQPYDAQGKIYAINQSEVMGGKLDRCLLSSVDYGQSWSEMRCHVLHFEINNNFITTTTPWALRVSHLVGTERGYLEQATFPLASTAVDKDWEVLDETGGVLFAVVDHHAVNTSSNESKKTWFGESNLYVSGKDGLRFVVSLKDILYTKTTEGKIKADFLDVADLPGVYFATQHVSASIDATSGKHRTLITMDKGSTWQPLTAPTPTCRSDTNCSLHLHLNEVSLNNNIQPVTDAKYAPGMILATGNEGSNLNLDEETCNVYYSGNAGGDWKMILEGPHYYAFANRGSIIVAISYTDTKNIKYSFDYGTTFTTKALAVTFSAKNKLVVSSLEAPPAVHGAVVMITGYQSISGDPVTLQIDFADLISAVCQPSDYLVWSPQSADLAAECWLGTRAVYTRRKLSSVCIEDWSDGIVPDHPVASVRCQCTKADYECDGEFTREVDGTCNSDTELSTASPDDGSGADASGNVAPTEPSVYIEEAVPSDCRRGMLWNFTLGYRKIAGDNCIGCAFGDEQCAPKLCPNTSDMPIPTYPMHNPTSSTPSTPPEDIDSGNTPAPGTNGKSSSSDTPITGVVIGAIVGSLVIGIAFVLVRRTMVQKRLNTYAKVVTAGGEKPGTYETPNFENPAFDSSMDEEAGVFAVNVDQQSSMA
eukprot:m.90861 g.90861  ORF g.90861 m.90861 type:complete len:838 (+) comp26431_c1_seq3:1654-4167(+)